MKKMAILVITLLGAFYHSLVMASFTQYSSDEVNFMHRAYLKHKPEITNLAGFSLLLVTGLSVAPSQLITTGLVAFANYLFAQRFVFHEEQTINVQ